MHAAGEQDVVRFDVAVDDILFVRVGRRVCHVAQNACDLADGKFALA